jgi:molybdate transport system substrate-binding protein
LRRFTVISSFTAAGLAVGALAACGSSGTSASSATSQAASAGASAASSGASAASSAAASATAGTTSITVFAAASLQGSFTQIGKQFEAAHPGAHVTFSFGPSSGLATQIINGAPASVFASAAPANMTQVVKAGDTLHSPSNFAKNKMEVAVPPGNPAQVTSVSNLSKSSVKVALCQPQVPCGTVAAEVFKNAGISVKPVTLQPDVKSVLTQVELGNVDAGMVYVTDVKAAGTKVEGVPVPSGDNASTLYPIATLEGASDKSVANEFVAYVMGPQGEHVLAMDGFEKP